MDLKKEELTKKLSLPRNAANNLLMVTIKKDYDNALNKLIKIISSKCKNICYVCLSKNSSQVVDEFKELQKGFDDMTFIELFNTKKSNNNKSSIQIKDPEDLEGIKKAVNKAIYKNNCSTVVYDTISKLLIYQTPDNILRFAHEVLSNPRQKKAHKLFIALEKDNIYNDENTKLIKDLSLFADKIIEI
jgi:SOS response regulatory protein OraA/RecX